MSDLESLREKVLGDHFVKQVRINEEEFHSLSREEKEKCSDLGNGLYAYDKKLDIPPEEIDSFLALKSFEAQMESKNAIITIKNIVVFIFVVSIIASILLLILQAQRF